MKPAHIKAIRRLSGMTLREFAEAVGLHGRDCARVVRRWEAGEREPGPASLSGIQAVADANGVLT